MFALVFDFGGDYRFLAAVLLYIVIFFGSFLLAIAESDRRWNNQQRGGTPTFFAILPVIVVGMALAMLLNPVMRTHPVSSIIIELAAIMLLAKALYKVHSEDHRSGPRGSSRL